VGWIVRSIEDVDLGRATHSDIIDVDESIFTS